MLKRIIRPSQTLINFLLLLHLQLSKPQTRHLTRLVEGVIVGEGRKTLADVYRLWVDAPDESSVADFLRESPWDEQALQASLQAFVIQQILSQADQMGDEHPVLWVSLDDSTHRKDKQTKALETVDWVHDPKAPNRGSKKGSVCKGTVEVSLHLQLGGTSYRFAFRIYLRARTVRRLNRQRERENRLSFKSKYRLAREMLEELKALLPKTIKVYVLMDSWYTSKKLLKYCRRQRWHVIAAIKSNRKLNQRSLKEWDQSLKHKPYTRVKVAGRTYWVRKVTGRLTDVPFDVCVMISRAHKRHKKPRYYVCTDLSLSPQAILTGYNKRWPIEVDYYDLKQRLGASQWRVQSFEATYRWWVIVHVALIFLQWRTQQSQMNMGAVIRQHRADHARDVLIEACNTALQMGCLEPILTRFIAA